MKSLAKPLVAFVLLFLSLSLVSSVLFSASGNGSSGASNALERTGPLSVDLRVAVISSDSGFVEGVRSAFVARDFRVVPVSRAWEAVGKDLVVVGWDALGELSRYPGLVIALVNGSRLLAVAEPGVDALRVLFSGIVKPVRLGEKDEPSDPFAFLPMVEENGYLYPGCGQNMVLVRAVPIGGGKLAVEYSAVPLRTKSELAGTASLLVKESLVEQRSQQTRLESGAGTSGFLFDETPAWLYIGKYTSPVFVFSGVFGDAGATDFEVVAGWGQFLTDTSRGTYTWEIDVHYHGMEGLNGYSLPVKNLLGLWAVEPNSVMMDALTDRYGDQRIKNWEPLESPGNRYVLTIWGYPRVTWDTVTDFCYSALYGENVVKQATWKWGLTGYSSKLHYAMKSQVWMNAVGVLYFKVTNKANAFFYANGLGDVASSGQKAFYFRATTSRLYLLSSS
jgi:hypothetical protein